MLLRRITKHVREQNWFAIGLEFVVVVVGVYLGLQADAWNENRRERVRERIAMEQLLADFTTNSELAGQVADFHKDKVEELTFAMNALTRGELAESDEARFRNAFVSMFQLPPLGISMGGYEAMLGSGDFGLLQDEALKAKLVQLAARVEAEKSLLDYFRDLNRMVTMQPAYDLVLVVPNEARTNANLQVDFAAAQADVRILTIVAGRRRGH